MQDIEAKFWIALITAILGFGAWFIKRLLDDRRDNLRDKVAQDNLVRALFAEIDFNTRDMEAFLQVSPPLSLIREKLEQNPRLVPHITDARHTEIYRGRLDQLHSVPDGALQRIVNFYGLLEKIRVQIEGINLPSYQTISVEGRLNGMRVIRKTAFKAKQCGEQLLEIFKQQYPELELERLQGDTDDTEPDQLHVRLLSLTENLKTAKAARKIK